MAKYTRNEENLEEQDNQILNDVLSKYNITDLHYIKFWNREEIQLDGDFSFNDMIALTEAMKRMNENANTDSD